MSWIDIPSESCAAGDVPPTNSLMTSLRDNQADTNGAFSQVSPAYDRQGHDTDGRHSWMGYYRYFTRWYQYQDNPTLAAPDISVAGNKVAYAISASSGLRPPQDTYFLPPTTRGHPGLDGTNAGCILSLHYFARRGGNGFRIEALDLSSLVSDPETAGISAGGYTVGDTA